MPPLLPVRVLKVRLPTISEIIRLAVLVLLVAAAVGSTQLLPGASAQEAEEAAADDAAPAGQEDRSLEVTTDQALPRDRSLAVPPVAAAQATSGSLTRTDQVSNRSGRPAQPSQLTPPGQDRGQLATQRLEGTDACDEETTGPEPEICNRPLETRAGEFAGRTPPQLSAEQRLLAQQFSGMTTGDATDGTARRLGAGRNGDLSNEDLAIASVVTSGQAGQQPPAQEESEIPADATNAIDAILGVINAQPPE